ncbi:MAG: sugar nucleotide-binding protein [Nitrospirae bacterium]|nr:sugar nucleotide-binding protein [Nitrospirota bacterium]
MVPRAIITGAAGLIGHYLLKTASRWAPHWEVRGLTRQDVDLTDAVAVRRLWRDLQPHVVIHCAAQSRPGTCQQNPLNVYGETKVEAERIVLQNPRHSVIRVGLNAGTSPSGDRSFVEDMRNSVKSGRPLTLFTDEFRCPLPVGMTARAIWELIERGWPGLYHLGGAERLSRWEIGQALVPWYQELEGQMQPGSVKSYTGAPRPPDLSMRCNKLQGLLSFPLSGFRTWLAGRTSAGTDLWDYPD